MNLQTFRNRLKSKTKTLQNMIDKPEHTEEYDHEVQAQIFDMAGDIRKIMDRIPKYKDQKIKIRRKIYTEKQKYIKPYELLGKIIHYENLYFGLSVLPHEQRHQYFSVLSDYDEKANIQSTVIKTQEFINIAQKISEDDNIAAKYISEYALQIVTNTLERCETSEKNYLYNTGKIIIDLVDILRKIERKITGSMETIIIVYEEIVHKKNIYDKNVYDNKQSDTYKTEKLIETIPDQISYEYIIEKYRIDFGVYYGKINMPYIGHALEILYSRKMPQNITDAIPEKYINEKYGIKLIISKNNLIKLFEDIKDYYK